MRDPVPGEGGAKKSAALSAELWDHDGCVVAVRADGTTRGRARAFFASEWDLAFTEIKLRREWFHDDPEYRAEQEADGIEEPYDGFPLTPCAAGTPGGREYFVLAEECR